MSLDHILLGFLREPASGYDLKAMLEKVSRHFWHAELSQIYPTLKRLERQGLLESRSQPPDRGPDRRVYRITDEGRTELHRWLQDGPAVGRDRLEYVAQVFFLGQLEGVDDRLAFLERLEAALRSRSDTFEDIAGMILSGTGGPEQMPDDVLWMHLSLRMGQRVVDARLTWVEEARQVLGAGRAEEQ
jgi:PadR family transcriptional regulator, regulatory protein AphA